MSARKSKSAAGKPIKAWELHEKTMLLSDNDRPLVDKAFEQVRGRRSKLK